MSPRRFGLYCGVIAPIVWLGLIGTAGALRPDFSHVTHYISELGERGSSTESLVRYGGFVLTGVLYLVFATALATTLPRGRLACIAGALIAVEGLGRLGAGAFPCNPGCVAPSQGPNLHALFATIGFVSGILAAFFCGWLFRRIDDLRMLAAFSIACAAVAFVSLTIMTSAPGPTLPAGLLEHVATVSLSIWLLAVAARAAWLERASRREPSP
jgi:hypothetical membrane protein